MINIFYGDDRKKTQTAISRQLGKDYEVIDGTEVDPNNLPSIFLGTSLFGDQRKILIKDLSENKTSYAKLSDYLNTPHEIILWEKTFDKRLKTNKELLKSPNLKITEFKAVQKLDRNLAFNIYDTALRDGPRALKILDQLEQTEDPYRLLGAWIWKALDNYKKRPNEKEKRVLKELSRLDVQMKTTRLSSQPWLLLRSFLLRLSSL